MAKSGKLQVQNTQVNKCKKSNTTSKIVETLLYESMRHRTIVGLRWSVQIHQRTHLTF